MMTKKKSADSPGRLFVERWERINALQREEYRRLTTKERLRQFFHLMELAKLMNWQTSTQDEIDEVRRRWKKIKDKCG
jgi:hypothetical protein